MSVKGIIMFLGMNNRLGSRFWVNKTSQFSERYSDQMQDAMKQKKMLMLDQMYLSMIEYSKHDWHAAFDHQTLALALKKSSHKEFK